MSTLSLRLPESLHKHLKDVSETRRCVDQSIHRDRGGREVSQRS